MLDEGEAFVGSALAAEDPAEGVEEVLVLGVGGEGFAGEGLGQSSSCFALARA